MSSQKASTAVAFNQLTYRYETQDGSTPVAPIIPSFSLEIPQGSRTLLIGANGVGKTTLLRILAGQHLVAESMIRVFGESPFYGLELASEISLIDGYFPLDVDLKVSELLASGRNGVDPQLEKELIELLGVDPGWRMNRVSSGQKRRVQILLTLRKPSQLLLLDEVTSNLDVTMRSDLMAWLKARSEKQQLTVIYATHIFDGLWDPLRAQYWPTHILCMKFTAPPAIKTPQGIPELIQNRTSLLQYCETEIRADLAKSPTQKSQT